MHNTSASGWRLNHRGRNWKACRDSKRRGGRIGKWRGRTKSQATSLSSWFTYYNSLEWISSFICVNTSVIVGDAVWLDDKLDPGMVKAWVLVKATFCELIAQLNLQRKNVHYSEQKWIRRNCETMSIFGLYLNVLCFAEWIFVSPLIKCVMMHRYFHWKCEANNELSRASFFASNWKYFFHHSSLTCPFYDAASSTASWQLSGLIPQIFNSWNRVSYYHNLFLEALARLAEFIHTLREDIKMFLWQRGLWT